MWWFLYWHGDNFLGPKHIFFPQNRQTRLYLNVTVLSHSSRLLQNLPLPLPWLIQKLLLLCTNIAWAGEAGRREATTSFPVWLMPMFNFRLRMKSGKTRVLTLSEVANAQWREMLSGSLWVMDKLTWPFRWNFQIFCNPLKENSRSCYLYPRDEKVNE